MKCLLWQRISQKINEIRQLFLFDPSRTYIVLLGSNKKLTSGPLFFKIFDLKVCEKRIFSPKNVCFCDERPTLATHISKNKRERSTFLFDSSRNNIVLLGSNKKLTPGPLFLKILGNTHFFNDLYCI
jgi:hypothetical protein